MKGRKRTLELTPNGTEFCVAGSGNLMDMDEYGLKNGRRALTIAVPEARFGSVQWPVAQGGLRE